MTIPELNKLLDNLTQTHSREDVLEFSFALVEFMGLTPNGEKKPQLLSPQTQKLREYLSPAPLTAQPQLYRLNIDSENIRVRFAVLKKLDKRQIGQLVDNDPGSGSFQAASKGIINIPGRPVFIPSEPYFLHFVTTPAYDRLVLVFNQGEQKRILNFRNKLTHTQYNKIIQQWQGIAPKPKPEIAEQFWKSIDIKEVNKEFYKQIKERFDALLGIVKAYAPAHSEAATENQVKQFTVRLIGRYIFCWFLKEKGIIAHELIGKNTIAATENYYQNVLLKLFFETLNTKVQDRNPLTHEKVFEKIPYLNGGLFDESDEDKLFRDLDLDAWLLPFVEILESYDFTVDESSSQYQQVAVDPEMLGRIFENLLASQNEETEKLANQRKAFGAFYTPREIVDYMVIESIKAYLQTNWEQNIVSEKSKGLNNPEQVGDIFGNKKPQQLAIETRRYSLKEEDKAKIEKVLDPLFTTNPDGGHLKKEDKALLLSFLERVKILDPACGSGAFPMGILHKLVELHEVLGTVKSRYELKKDIMSHNIYGVDIMPMAIEIARLRAWLSLVLEEDYKPADTKHNFNIKPLPNLDFKFVCANSLIDSGYDNFVNEHVNKSGALTLQRLDGEIQKMQTLRDRFFNIYDPQEKETAQDEFLDTRQRVTTEFESLRKNYKLGNFLDNVNKWNPFDDSYASPFFSPTWMFGIQDGFDMVIGNPPYVQIQKLNEEVKQELETQKYNVYSRTGDLYQLFYEQGINFLRQNAILCLITSNTWLRTGYGEKQKAYLFKSCNPLFLIDFADYQVFEATVNTNILIIKKENDNNSLQICNIKKDFNSSNNLSDYFRQNAAKAGIKSWVASSGIEAQIKAKIEANGIPLKEWNVKIFRGVLTGFNEAFIINSKTKDELIAKSPKSAEIIRPILRGRDIQKYKPNWAELYLIHVPWHFPLHKDASIAGASTKAEEEFKKRYPAIYNHLLKYKSELSKRNKTETGIRYEWYALQRWGANYMEDFFRPKIIWKRIGSVLRFSYDESAVFCLDSTCFAVGEDIKFLVGYLNSIVSKRELLNNAPKTGTGDVITSVQNLEPLKVPNANDMQKREVSNLVEKCISILSNNLESDISDIERKIDDIIYKLFDFTKEEVEFIKLKATKLSE